MFRRNKNALPPVDPIEQLKALPLVGDTIRLPNGAIFQRPHPAIIRALQAIEPRVRYFPTNFEKAGADDANYAYYRGVTDLLPGQILRDFPGVPKRTYQRGTVVSLRDEFPHFWHPDDEILEFGVGIRIREGAQRLPMNNVLTILRTGSDRGGELGKLGMLSTWASKERYSLNNHTEDYLMLHTACEMDELLERGEWQKSDNLFPGLLVYEAEKVGFGEDFKIKDPSALLAVYVTDRLTGEHRLKANPTTSHIGGIALGGASPS